MSEKLQKIVDYTLVGLAFILSVIFFFSFDLENILWERENFESIGNQEIEKNRAKDYTGYKAKEDILSISSIEEWEDVIAEVEYVTITPKKIIKTNVYSLAKWESYYQKKPNGTTGRRRADAKKTNFDFSASYTPFYIVELEDGGKILVQMNRGLAKRIEKGENVSLPLGRKIGFSNLAKKLLAPICKKENVDDDYVLYTINNEWQKNNSTKIFLEKFALSFVLFIVLAVLLQLGVDKLIFEKKESKEGV